MRSPTFKCWNLGRRRSALGPFAGNRSRSTHSAVYHAPRCQPICTSQGQIRSGGASIVMACVVTAIGFRVKFVTWQVTAELGSRRTIVAAQPLQRRITGNSSRGHSGMTGLVLGCTAHKVIHLSDRPVLVVR
jgi:hypothetical protein